MKRYAYGWLTVRNTGPGDQNTIADLYERCLGSNAQPHAHGTGRRT